METETGLALGSGWVRLQIYAAITRPVYPTSKRAHFLSLFWLLGLGRGRWEPKARGPRYPGTTAILRGGSSAHGEGRTHWRPRRLTRRNRSAWSRPGQCPGEEKGRGYRPINPPEHHLRQESTEFHGRHYLLAMAISMKANTRSSPEACRQKETTPGVTTPNPHFFSLLIVTKTKHNRLA